ncbi:MAG: GntR family transcriptional regulator, partial [Pseudomonadota bacterium]
AAPKHACLQEAFERGIRSGTFRPGARVPPETKLSQRLPVSLGTVQRALADLAQRGLIIRGRRTGTFIADRGHRATETHVYRFHDLVTGELLLPFTRVLRVVSDTTTGPWSDVFRSKRLVRIDRLVWVEQEPPAYSSVFVSYGHGKPLLKRPLEELHGSSWHRFLVERFHLPTLRMDHKFSCRELDADACAALLVGKGTLGIIWDIKDLSFDDQPILFQRYQLPPNHRPIEMLEQRT